MPLKIYIAGPDVFYPDAVEVGIAKRKICEKHGFKGIFPLDLLPNDLFTSKYDHNQQAKIIQKACIDGIRDCDILVANMTPFRGTGMDNGTAVEMGAAHMINKPVFGYSADGRSYLDKVVSAQGDCTVSEGNSYDSKGQLIEDFNKIDNCMTTESCEALFLPSSKNETHLQLFEKTIIHIKETFNV